MDVHCNIIQIAQNWQQYICLSADDSINKMWHVHAIQYYLAITRNEELIYAITWLSFEDVSLSETSEP